MRPGNIMPPDHHLQQKHMGQTKHVQTPLRHKPLSSLEVPTIPAMSHPIPSVITSFHDNPCTEERPTTPPNITNVPPDGTPLIGKHASSLPFTSTHIMRDERVTAMRYEITGRVVGPVPAQKFLDRYLPSPNAPSLPDHKGPMSRLAQEMSNVKKETQMYGIWVIITVFRSFCV